METRNIKPTQANLTKILKVLDTSTRTKKKVIQSNEDLLSVVDILEQLMRTGTMLTYPEKEIDFKDYPLSPIKKLAVSICSTETYDMAVLHKLHTQTRTV